MAQERNHELARFIRVKKNPYDMTRDELIDELHVLAEYASHRITEVHSLRNIINNAMKKED